MVCMSEATQDTAEGKDHYTIQVDRDLVEQAYEEFEGETTIRGLVRQSMQRGIESSRREQEYLNIIQTLSETNRELIQD
jgi:hypothetical protein